MTELRLDHIAKMMRALQWETGESGPALAKEWNLSVDRLKHLAAEASRRVRAEITDVDYVTATVCSALQTVLRHAIAESDNPRMVAGPDGSMVEGDPNKSRKTVIEAAKTWADITGARAPNKIQLSGGVALDDIDEMRRTAGANNECETTTGEPEE